MKNILLAALIALSTVACTVRQAPCAVVEKGVCIDDQLPAYQNQGKDASDVCEAQAQTEAPCPDLKAEKCEAFWTAFDDCLASK